MNRIQLTSRIRDLVDKIEQNPHWLSVQSGITYRIVLGLYKSPQIPPTTSIGTLIGIADVLGVRVDDLYEKEIEGQNKSKSL